MSPTDAPINASSNDNHSREIESIDMEHMDELQFVTMKQQIKKEILDHHHRHSKNVLHFNLIKIRVFVVCDQIFLIEL